MAQLSFFNTLERRVMPFESIEPGKVKMYTWQNTRNWDMERVPLMDRVIMQVALAEITSCPTIPLSVSINEYIEIAKSYSTPNSARYINATLDNISKKLIAERKLIKNA